MTVSRVAHRQPRAVGDNADRAVQTDILQAFFLRQPLALVDRFGRLELRPFRMTERGAVVQADFGVERIDAPVFREDQRVDLDQIGVAFDKGVVELLDQENRLIDGFRDSGWRL